jgi:type I restriction enzyme M protein
MTDVVQDLWAFCHTLRHDGIDYGDYIEEITYLLFIKMAAEREIRLPDHCDWPSIMDKRGPELTRHYSDVLHILGRSEGILGDIFSDSQSRIANPANLKRLIDLIQAAGWTRSDIDVGAQVFEGLLERAASEGKKGAGQYFTPRPLIQAIVECIKPDPRVASDFVIGDPAAGTGGFLIEAHEWLLRSTEGRIDQALARRLKASTYYGTELVSRPRRLALMNLFLHNLEPEIELGDSIYSPPNDRRFDVVITNPPFGTKGTVEIPNRDDLPITTSNKQLNFLQHVLTILKPQGRAAVVLPDNCLFADQAGAVFQVLTERCDLHTVLRLPNGTFSPYSPGTRTNVVFFTKGLSTQETWIYDARTNVPHITKRERPLTVEHFSEFIRCFGEDPFGHMSRSESCSSENRWKSFGIRDIRERDFKIDSFRWLKHKTNGPSSEEVYPEELVTDVITELEKAIAQLNIVLNTLQSERNDG